MYMEGSPKFPLTDAINLLDSMSEVNVFLCSWIINELSTEVRTELLEVQTRLIKDAIKNIECHIKNMN